jgi:hypothetical protein
MRSGVAEAAGVSPSGGLIRSADSELFVSLSEGDSFWAASAGAGEVSFFAFGPGAGNSASDSGLFTFC